MFLRLLVLVLLPLLFVSKAFGVIPNTQVVATDPSDRLQGGTVLGEWATKNSLDGWTSSNAVSVTATGTSLALWGNSTTTPPSITRASIPNGPDLDLGFNDYLQIRLKLPAEYSGDLTFEYGTSTRPGFAKDRQFSIPAAALLKDGAFHTYRVALGLEVFWRDSLTDLRVTPTRLQTAQMEVDYLEIGDVAGTAPLLNLDTNFKSGLNAKNTNRMESKHFCIWWDPKDTNFTTAHARRALRMCEESLQVYCTKLGHLQPFYEFGDRSGSTPRYKLNFVTWYDGYWAGGYANRPHLNVGWSGLGDEGWGNPVPHEFGHCTQMAQPGNLAGGHWESHANYLRAERNLHFYDAIPNAIPALDNLTGNSNYRPDHNRHIYADQRYYLSLDDFGTQFGLPENYAAAMWRDGASGKTIPEKLASQLPIGTSVKDVACECMKHWPMLDFVQKERLRAQHWGTEANRAAHFWRQGAQLIPQQDKPGWWRVPLERAPDMWAYQMHDLSAAPGSTITAELRGYDMPGQGEDWRWCIAAISPDDTVRYSPVWSPGTHSFTLNSKESQVFLIVTATPDQTALDLDSLSNTKAVDKDPARLRYGYEVRLQGAAPASHRYLTTDPSGSHRHPNGGGIVGPNATVADSAYVGPNARVIGSAQVLGNARIEDFAVVQGNAIVQDNARVTGSALVEDNATVSENARVRDRAHVHWGAILLGRALACGYCEITNTTVQEDAIVRGCAHPDFGGTLGGTAIADHDYSMGTQGSPLTDGVHFSHVPWGGWWDAFYPQTQRKPRGLVASYRTQESDGEQWWDEFGALHAILRGSPTREINPLSGSSVLTLNGNQQYAVLDRSLADTPKASFACWVKPTAPLGATEPILFLGKSAAQSLSLTRTPSGKVSVTLGAASSTVTLTSTSPLTTDVWQHVAYTLDGSMLRLYLNGVLEASAPTSLTLLDILAPNTHTDLQANYLGRDWAGLLFRGSFEDVRFYNVALSDQEVLQEAHRKATIQGAFSVLSPTEFDGKTTRAESGIRNGRNRTLSAWVKLPAPLPPTYQPLFDSTNELSATPGAGLGVQNGTWTAKLDGLPEWNTGISVSPGTWQHVALAFNGVKATLFINASPKASQSYTGPATDAQATGKCYRIGYAQTNTDAASRLFFTGSILAARIHDRALSATEIVLDTDGDGFNDSIEIQSGTNPLDPRSKPLSYTLAGQILSSEGTPVSGATLRFSQQPGALQNATVQGTTDATGRYSVNLLPGVWFLSVQSDAFDDAPERSVDLSKASLSNLNWTLTPKPLIRGHILSAQNGQPLAGATVYLSQTPEALESATITTLTDANGAYIQPLTSGSWNLSAKADGFYGAPDLTVQVSAKGAQAPDLKLQSSQRNTPSPENILFSQLTDSDTPTLTSIGPVTRITQGGAPWFWHTYALGSGFRYGDKYATPIAVQGVSIVVAVNPQRNKIGTDWTSLVDLFYNRVVLGVRNVDGQLIVMRNGQQFRGTPDLNLKDGVPVILSLVIQPTGAFRLYQNGHVVMQDQGASDMTSLIPNVAGPFACGLTVGRNLPDGWSTFNGGIGDVFVYKTALSDADRTQLEADLARKFLQKNAPDLPTPVTPSAQSIIFPRIAEHLVTDSPVLLAATASSHLPVTFSVISGPASIGPDAQSLILSGSGTVQVQASQPGDAFFQAAPPVTQAFLVRLAPQSLTFFPLPSHRVSDPPFALSATSSSGLPVFFTLNSGPASLSEGTLTLTGSPGTVSVTASQNGDATYAPASPITREFLVTQNGLPSQPQTITFLPPPAITYGDQAVPLKAFSSSGLPVSLSVVSGSATLSGNLLSPTGEGKFILRATGNLFTPTAAGKVTLRATQAGDALWLPAPEVHLTLTVAKKTLLVRVANATRLVGSPNPSFNPVYEGFVGNDTPASLQQAPIVTTSANPSSRAGTYRLHPSEARDPNYRFVYKSGLLSVVGFGGTYEALLRDSQGVPLGKLQISIPPNALSFSGKLLLATEEDDLPLTGILSSTPPFASASATWSRTQKGLPPLSLSLMVSGDSLSVSLQRDSLPYLASLPSEESPSRLFSEGFTPWIGSYSFALGKPSPSTPSDPRLFPLGRGYAAGSVALDSAALALSGKLADGTPFSASLRPDRLGRYRVFLKPYTKRTDSFLAGFLRCAPHPDTDRLPWHFQLTAEPGNLVWTKAPLTSPSPSPLSDVSYPSGFGPLLLASSVTPWTAPTDPSATLPITLAQRLGLTSNPQSAAPLSIAFQADTASDPLGLGSQQSLLPTLLSLNTLNRFTILWPTPISSQNPTQWTLSVDSTTGVFSGSFTLSDLIPPSNTPTIRPVPFSGILRQPLNQEDPLLGTGFFLLPSASGLPVSSGEILLTRLPTP